MKRGLIIAIATVIAFFTLQAIYWPLILKPGTPLHFWQMHWAAEIGYRVGAPAVGVILLSTLTGLPQHMLAIGLTIAWSAALAWVAKVGIDNFDHQTPKKTARAPEPAVTPEASTPTASDSPVQTPAQLARSAARPSAPSD